jgi:hypothetical protein
VERTPEQIARTEALFRNVNEEIRDASGRFEAEVGEFVCECGDPTCTEHVEVPLEEYEAVRSHPTRFLVRPGHVKGPVERVVSRNRRYAVIEKVDRVLATIVKRLNPRPEAT